MRSFNSWGQKGTDGKEAVENKNAFSALGNPLLQCGSAGQPSP